MALGSAGFVAAGALVAAYVAAASDTSLGEIKDQVLGAMREDAFSIEGTLGYNPTTGTACATVDGKTYALESLKPADGQGIDSILTAINGHPTSAQRDTVGLTNYGATEDGQGALDYLTSEAKKDGSPTTIMTTFETEDGTWKNLKEGQKYLFPRKPKEGETSCGFMRGD